MNNLLKAGLVLTCSVALMGAKCGVGVVSRGDLSKYECNSEQIKVVESWTETCMDSYSPAYCVAYAKATFCSQRAETECQPEEINSN